MKTLKITVRFGPFLLAFGVARVTDNVTGFRTASDQIRFVPFRHGPHKSAALSLAS